MAFKTNKEKELKTDWPIVSGTGADDKHEGRQTNLIAERGSLVPIRTRAGIQ